MVVVVEVEVVMRVLPVVPVVVGDKVLPVGLEQRVKVLWVVPVVVRILAVVVVVLEPPVQIIQGTMRVMVVPVNSSEREVRLQISGMSTVKVVGLRVVVEVVYVKTRQSMVVHLVEAVVGTVETITGTWV